MRVTRQATPAAEATARVLKLFCPSQVARQCPRFDNNYLVLSYREDFSRLRQAELSGYRLADLIQFLLLLDFIEGTSEDPVVVKRGRREQFWRYLQLRHWHLSQHHDLVEPNSLGPDQAVSWLEFVTFAALSAIERALDGFRCYLSRPYD